MAGSALAPRYLGDDVVAAVAVDDQCPSRAFDSAVNGVHASDHLVLSAVVNR